MVKTQFKLIRRPEVIKMTGRSKTSLQLDEKAGLITPPISIGDRSVAYIQQEIDAIICARVAGKSNSEIKDLVTELVKQREQVL